MWTSGRLARTSPILRILCGACAAATRRPSPISITQRPFTSTIASRESCAIRSGSAVSRTKPLTIIGGRPSETYGPLANDNGFLDEITTRPAKFAPKRAASVVDVAELLDAETKSEVPLSVQIIGHAISGQLLLGAPYISDADKH